MTASFEPSELVPPGWSERHPDEVPTGVTAVIETIDADGRTGFHRITSNDLPEWREIGLLRAALGHLEADWADRGREDREHDDDD